MSAEDGWGEARSAHGIGESECGVWQSRQSDGNMCQHGVKIVGREHDACSFPSRVGIEDAELENERGSGGC